MATSKIDAFALRFIDRVIQFRWLVLLGSVLVLAAAGYGAQHLRFANDYRVFFSPDNPELKAFEEMQATFTKNDNILFVIKPDDGKTFTPKITALVEEITEAAWQIPHARRVDSITNFQHTYATEDDLVVEDLIKNGKDMSAKELAEKQNIGINEPLLYGNLIARDIDTIGVNVIQQFPQKDLTELPSAVMKARAIKDAMLEKYPEVTIVLAGGAMLNMAFMEAGMYDMQHLTPVMYGLLLLVMLLLIRSVTATFSTLLVILFSMIAAMGLAGYAGVQLTPISIMAPTIILTLAIADSVHVLVTLVEGMRAGMTKNQALRESLRINFLAVAITSITTLVGFLTLNTLDSPPFRHLGSITAAGIGFAWLFSITLLPAMVSILPLKVKPRKETSKLNVWLNAYSHFVVRNYKPVLVLSSLLAIGLIAMIPRIQINDQWVEYFDYNIPIRADSELAMKELGGLYLLEYPIPSKEVGGVNDPEYVKNLDKFAIWLRSQPEMVHVYSYSDIMKRLNKNMHGDNPEWYAVPNDRDLAAQYLLLYEMSLPYGLDLNDRVDIEKSATRLTATLGNVNTEQVREFLVRAENWQKENVPDYMFSKATGPTVMFSFISQRNIESMFLGNAIAIGMIAIIIIFAIRSFGIGMLSLIPNTIPILMTMGIWALTYEKIGMASATVTSVALGIMVDDTVHFLTKYLRARREKGLDRVEAIHYAFDTVGKALVVTTVILTLGFAVMATSSFQINMQLGMITAATMVIALIMDFLLLPALLMVGHKKQIQGAKNEKITARAA